MKKATLLLSLSVILNTYAGIDSYQGISSKKGSKCFLQTDISQHKDDIAFFTLQRNSYKRAEILENQKNFGDERISLIISHGEKERSSSRKRAPYQPADPTAAIDREFLASPGAVYSGFHLEASNKTFTLKSGPKAYALKVKLKGLTPSSYKYNGNGESYECNKLRLIP